MELVKEKFGMGVLRKDILFIKKKREENRKENHELIMWGLGVVKKKKRNI